MTRGTGVPPVQSHGQDGRSTRGETPPRPRAEQAAHQPEAGAYTSMARLNRLGKSEGD